jgi:hypothetical protein
MIQIIVIFIYGALSTTIVDALGWRFWPSLIMQGSGFVLGYIIARMDFKNNTAD